MRTARQDFAVVNRDICYDLLIFREDSSITSLARKECDAVLRKINGERRISGIFSIDELSGERASLFDAMLQTRGGGVVLFLLNRLFSATNSALPLYLLC